MVTMREIRRAAHAIARLCRPQRIVLFGSYAYGRPSEDSDVDLLVLMNGSRLDERAVRVREAIGGGASAGGQARGRGSAGAGESAEIEPCAGGARERA